MVKIKEFISDFLTQQAHLIAFVCFKCFKQLQGETYV